MARKKQTVELQTSSTSNLGFLDTLIDWVNDADDLTLWEREQAEKCRNYYDSKQWTDAEARVLARRKQAAIVVNRLKPKMDGLMGMERANKTTAKAYPRTPQHEKAAEAATEAIRYVLQSNFYDQKRSSSWDNLLIEGTGGLEVIVKNQGGDPKIVVNHIMWDRIIHDPRSRRKDFTDARYLGQVIWMDYEEAVEKFPKAKDSLDALLDGSSTFDDKPRWMDTKRRRVKIVELYYYKGGECWYACFTRGGYCENPRVSPYKNEDGETEWPYVFASLFVDREGCRYGAAMQYLDIQDEINKRRSKALHLVSVRQIRLERGAVENVETVRSELAKPDGVVETTPGMEFEVLKTGDMAAAQFNLLQEAKQEIDAVGYNSAASGKDQRSMSGIALQNRQVASQTELAPMFDILKHLDIRLYRKVWNRIKQYWRAEKWIRVTDDQEALRWVGLNRPITKGEQIVQDAKDKGANPQELAQLIQQVSADPTMQTQVSKANDIANLDVDIIIDDAPDSVTMQQEEFVALSEMVKSGIPIPPTAIIKASSLKDKDLILKEMNKGPQIPPQVQEQMQKMGQELQALQQENQQLKGKEQQAMAKLAQKSQADSQKLMAAQQSEAAAQQSARQMETFQTMMSEQFDRWKAELDANTKVVVAQIAAKASSDAALIAAEQKASEQFANDSGLSGSDAGGTPRRRNGERPLDQLSKMLDEHKQRQDALAQKMSSLEQAVVKPKRVVRGPDGRISGVETIQ